jgi:hypothetical protein
MAILAAIVLGYLLVYGAGNIAVEGRKKFGAYAAKVKAGGSPGEKVGVAALEGLGWLGKSFKDGVSGQAREDARLIRETFSPEGRAKLDRERRERRDRRIRNRKARDLRKQDRERIARAKGLPVESDDPAAEVRCPDCRGLGCYVCGGDGWRPAKDVHPDRFAGPEPGEHTKDGAAPATDPAPPAEDAPEDFSDIPEGSHRSCMGCGRPLTVAEMQSGLHSTCAFCDAQMEAKQAEKAARLAATTNSPDAPAYGTAPTNGGTTMSDTSGEAPNFTAAIAQMNAMAAKAEHLAREAASLGSGGEILHSSLHGANVDSTTLGSVNDATGASYDAQSVFQAVAARYRSAAGTLTQQQGQLHEAHVNQQQAATHEFLSA